MDKTMADLSVTTQMPERFPAEGNITMVTITMVTITMVAVTMLFAARFLSSPYFWHHWVQQYIDIDTFLL
jgi:hypothetical protein